jgi:hypothetical protein
MTNFDQDLTQISFHEASIAGILRKESTVKLDLEDVFIAGIQKAAEVEIEGVSAVLRDGLPIDDFHMETEDGEILTLRKEDGQFALAVQWNDFAAKSQHTVVYNLIGPKIVLRITPSVAR